MSFVLPFFTVSTILQFLRWSDMIMFLSNNYDLCLVFFIWNSIAMSGAVLPSLNPCSVMNSILLIYSSAVELSGITTQFQGDKSSASDPKPTEFTFGKTYSHLQKYVVISDGPFSSSSYSLSQSLALICKFIAQLIASLLSINVQLFPLITTFSVKNCLSDFLPKVAVFG